MRAESTAGEYSSCRDYVSYVARHVVGALHTSRMRRSSAIFVLVRLTSANVHILRSHASFCMGWDDCGS